MPPLVFQSLGHLRFRTWRARRDSNPNSIHTHASLMLKQDIHPKIVSERLGHATVSITLDTYSHVMPGLQEASALKFEEGLKTQTAKG